MFVGCLVQYVPALELLTVYPSYEGRFSTPMTRRGWISVYVQFVSARPRLAAILALI